MSAALSVVIVPGLGNSGPQHWQTLLQAELPNASRVEQMFWNLPIRWQWVHSLEQHMKKLPGPVVLVGHSAGALTIVEWALRGGSSQNVIGALLVAPPDVEDIELELAPLWLRKLLGWAPISRNRLPFPSVLVTSSNDPMSTETRLHALAGYWGSKIQSLGEAGHINADSGYGDWPGAKEIVCAFNGQP